MKQCHKPAKWFQTMAFILKKLLKTMFNESTNYNYLIDQSRIVILTSG